MQRNPKIIVHRSQLGGKGVFATELITKGEIIEICPVLIIPREQVSVIHQTVLHDYYFIWGEDESEAAIALGYGSLYNHALIANTDYYMDFENETIDFFARQSIHPGEELLINYSGASGKRDDLWFEVKTKDDITTQL